MIKSTRKYYTRIASKYDAERFTGKGYFNYLVDSLIIKDLVAKSGAKTIVDIPSGTGRTAEYLIDDDVLVVGVDLTWEMLKNSLSKKSTEKLKLDLIQSDASMLPFRSNSIPCIVSLRFFHLFSESELNIFIKEFKRVLEPGGYLIASYDNKFYGGCVSIIRKLRKQFGPNLLSKNDFCRAI